MKKVYDDLKREYRFCKKLNKSAIKLSTKVFDLLIFLNKSQTIL